MRSRFARLFGTFAAIFLLNSAAVVGCGHSTFDFLSDEANMDSGSGGGSPPATGSGGASGGQPQAGVGGLPPFTGSGGLSGGGEGGDDGGLGGAPPCVGPGCPRPCCNEIPLACGPFDPCNYCSRPEQCLSGFTCDTLTDQCLPACDDNFDCPDHLWLCDKARGVCTECDGDVHCRDRKTCLLGLCISCDNEC